MKMPLRTAVEAYIGKGMARFHMPGHKGRGIGIPAFERMLPWDITEVAGADSLFQAQGAILELEQEAARLYGAGASLLSAGGATLCIQAMLALFCKAGGKVIAGRGLHRSAVNTMALLDLRPVWMYPDSSAGPWYSGRYTPESLNALLKAQPDAQAVYITSPDYFGVMSDISALAAQCRQAGIPLLVDNAHGAHLRWLAQHPIELGADACADSLHKTLPAMTGGALLHLADGDRAGDARRWMAMFGSTSPSYPILLSCEAALAYAEADGKRGFEEAARSFKQQAAHARERGFALPEGRTDPAKLALGFAAAGMEPDGFGAYLRGYGIEPEYLSRTACVLMANGRNRLEDFSRLERALAGTPVHGCRRAPEGTPLPRCEAVMTPREAAFSPCEEIPVEEAAGRIAARESSPCPPGIPVIMSGERISEEAVRCLRDYGTVQVSVVAGAKKGGFLQAVMIK